MCLKSPLKYWQEDVLLLYPFHEGSQFITYDSATHRATLEDNRDLAHAASYSNASRVTTYLRGGVEQMHGALKQTYKVLDLNISYRWLALNFCKYS